MNTNKTRNQIPFFRVKNILQKIFQERKLLQERFFKADEETITNIINSSTIITHQIHDQLSRQFDKNTKKLINTETENKGKTKMLDTFEEIIDYEINEMKEKINKLEKKYQKCKQRS